MSQKLLSILKAFLKCTEHKNCFLFSSVHHYTWVFLFYLSTQNELFIFYLWTLKLSPSVLSNFLIVYFWNFFSYLIWTHVGIFWLVLLRFSSSNIRHCTLTEYLQKSLYSKCYNQWCTVYKLGKMWDNYLQKKHAIYTWYS